MSSFTIENKSEWTCRSALRSDVFSRNVRVTKAEALKSVRFSSIRIKITSYLLIHAEALTSFSSA